MKRPGKLESSMLCMHPARRRSKGFTLLELLIALTIGLVILAAGMAVCLSAGRASQVSQYETQLNEDGVLALNLIQAQIKQAGYSEQIIPHSGAAVAGNFAGIAVRGCDGGFTDDKVAFDSLTCVTGAGSDSIAVRYQATEFNTYPTGGTPPAPTNCIGNGISVSTPSQVSPAPTLPPGVSALPDYALADNRYSVRSSGGQPNLVCRGIQNSAVNPPTGDTEPLLANVEEMHLRYGVASRPSLELAPSYDPMRHQIINYLTATEIDGLPTTSTLPNTTDDRWGRVLSVRVCLLMRSDRPVPDAPPGGFTYKTCDNIDAKSTDGHLRRTYTTTVLLRNRLIVP